MITPEEAKAASRIFAWCRALEQSEAFRELILKWADDREAEADRCGTDVTKPPAERAEHHRALHLMRELRGHRETPSLLAKRQAEAEEILRQWAEQQGKPFVPLTDSYQ